MAKTNRKSYPLKKVLYTAISKGEGVFEFLECGHKLPQAQDIYGAYYPVKRRCHKCAKGIEKDY